MAATPTLAATTLEIWESKSPLINPPIGGGEGERVNNKKR